MVDVSKLTDEELLALANKDKGKPIPDDLSTASEATLAALAAGKPKPGPVLPSMKATDEAKAREPWRPQTDSMGKAALGGLNYGLVETLAPSGMIDLAGKYVVAPSMYGLDKAVTNIANAITGGNTQSKSLEDYRRMAGVTEPLSKHVQDYMPMYQGKEGTWARPVSDITELLPQAVMSPGNMAKNALVFGAIPGATGYVAEQATKGTRYEPYAKPATQFLTALAGGVVTDPTRGQKNLVSATKSADKSQFSQAIGLLDNANTNGVNLTVDEALAAATQGGTNRLSNMRRIAENTEGGRDILQPFTANRPQQTAAAAERMLDSITPAPANPYLVAQKAQASATDAFGQVRKDINSLAAPYYDSSRNARIPPNEYANLSNLPSFQTALRELRNDPELGMRIKDLPDNTVGTLDAIKKRMDTRITQAKGLAKPDEDLAAIIEQQRKAVVSAADKASSDYALARYIGNKGRENFLTPLDAGPLGQISRGGTPDNLRSAIIPSGKNVLERQNEDIATALQHIAGQDPQLAKDAVRVAMGAEKNAAFRPRTSAVEGADLYGGSRFANAVGAQGQQRNNFMSALEASAGPQVASNAGKTLDVLAATGYRPATGSRTAFNAQDMADLRGTSIASMDATKPLARVGDFLERMQMAGKTKELSEFLTGGRVSLEQLIELRKRYPDLVSADMVQQLIGRSQRGAGFAGRAAVPAGLLAGDD